MLIIIIIIIMLSLIAKIMFILVNEKLLKKDEAKEE